MNITRHNYEEYFLLYVDNELSAEDRKAVEAFVLLYPDLEEELAMLQSSILLPEEKIQFEGKESLFKSSTPIHEANCEEYFVLYADNELSNQEKEQVEQFVYRHPQYQEAFELIQQVKLDADPAIVFPDKSLLYRSGKDDKVIVLRWWRIAVAAAVLLFVAGTTWYITNRSTDTNPGLAGTTGPAKPHEPAVTTPTITSPDSQEALAAADDHNDNTTHPQQQQPAVTPAAPQMTANSTPAATQQVAQATSHTAGKNNSKINTPASNLPTPSPVTLSEAVANNDEPKKVNTGVVTAAIEPDETVALATPANDKQHEKPTYTVLETVDETTERETLQNTFASNDQVNILNTSINKKTALRGLFRKVSRVFEKATNMSPNDDDNSIRIANLEIDLK